MKIELPNGIVLDDSEYWAADAQRYARGKGFAGARVFVATHPNGSKNYLLVLGEQAEHEDTTVEGICCHIDMMAADRDMPE